jgi:catechol 2,3-dioxygenase-like lactoylglutathione lyase family enzyme
VTRNLHLALLARSGREQVDTWWEAMTAAGYVDDGAPGPRPQYSPGYYGAFVRDPDGNSVEAVHHDEPRGGENRLDHLWIRVRDLDASRHFYETVAPVVGLRVREGAGNRFHVAGTERSFALVRDDPVTENVHLAFPAPDRATVEAFHGAALEAGFLDNGAPGERPRYHVGYYGAYLLDPDGNNVEAVFHDRTDQGVAV